MDGKGLESAREQGTSACGRGESIEEEICVVEPGFGVLGEFFGHCLEEVVCFLLVQDLSSEYFCPSEKDRIGIIKTYLVLS